MTSEKNHALCLMGGDYHEVLNQNETVNAEKFAQIFKEKKCLSLVNLKGVLLLHDNARIYIV